MRASTLSLCDILFGTFVNPRHETPETGFYNGASRRIVEMLMFKDVSKPRIAAMSEAGQ